eukprot:TRINITY_DN2556_c0_g2_i2.p1 TRINITY_DN2556_c0_g2~~TRINITY_DN2556_c0_g2_i2.p1  ORF type:complete len:772 (-),score=212.70 TRINITY_DN2556_c0_g2_i2:37-2103(-)
MTLGMDVSDLFQNIIMASHTTDVVQKKMIYLFLKNYARNNEELAVLAVNSLVRDTHDNSPMIRGLALRWLCSMGTPTLVEHMLEPLKRGLVDVNAYTRRSATMSCAKVFRIAPEAIKDPGIINRLYELIRDRDPLVVINALHSLDEILESEGGVVINQKIVLHLMSHLKEFNAWGQAFIVELMQKYTPQSEEELFIIMNLLDSRCQHPNSSLVLATINLFLNFTQTQPEIHQHVYLRIKAPVMALMLQRAPEIQYCTLGHIWLLCKRVPTLFSSDYKFFYPKNYDPEYLKLSKLSVLQSLATTANVKEIMVELSYYATDRDTEFAKEAIRTIGRLAIRIPPASAYALELLLGFLELEQLSYVLETTLGVMKDMLRRFPAQAADVVPRLAGALDVVQETNAVAAAVFMVGSFGDILPEAPYIIEELVDEWDKHEAKVKNQLLVASLKLFFKRPKEVKPVLGKLFARAVDDFSDPDVHDRAIFYYRLLSADVNTCKAVINSSQVSVDQGFAEDDDGVEIDRLYEEFNTLSVIFRQGSERFLKEDIDLEDDERKNDHSSHNPTTAFSQPAEVGPPPLQLNEAAILTPQDFESQWKSLPPSAEIQTHCNPSKPSLDQIANVFASYGIKAVAKGGPATAMKFFLYAQQVNDAFYLVELTVNTGNAVAQAIIKSTNSAIVPGFRQYLEQILITL